MSDWSSDVCSSDLFRDARRSEYSGRIPPGALVGAAEAQIAIIRLNGMAADVPLDAPWTAPKAVEWDSQTFQTWIDANLLSTNGKALLPLAIESVRSEERRGGKECVRTWRSRVSLAHYKKKQSYTTRINT